MQNKQKKRSSTTIWVIIITVAILGMISGCSSSNYYEDERNAFSNQMHKDPSNWSSEEKSRYNDFIDWSNKN